MSYGKIASAETKRMFDYIRDNVMQRISEMVELDDSPASSSIVLLSNDSDFQLAPELSQSTSAFLSANRRLIINWFNSVEWPSGFIVSLGIDFEAHVSIDYVGA